MRNTAANTSTREVTKEQHMRNTAANTASINAVNAVNTASINAVIDTTHRSNAALAMSIVAQPQTYSPASIKAAEALLKQSLKALSGK